MGFPPNPFIPAWPLRKEINLHVFRVFHKFLLFFVLVIFIEIQQRLTTPPKLWRFPGGVRISPIYSLLFNTSHGILIREKWDFPPNPFIPAWSLSKSLLCLLLHPGLKPFLFTWKQWWCHCYINRGLLCSVFQPGLWVNGMACLVIQTCFWKKSGMSPNTTWLVLKRKEYIVEGSNVELFSIYELPFKWQFKT